MSASPVDKRYALLRAAGEELAAMVDAWERGA